MRTLLALFLSTAAALVHAQSVTLPGGTRFVETETVQEGHAVRIQGVTFTEKQARLAVIDNPAGLTLAEAMTSAQAIAGTNGAYFHPTNEPVGLVIADGKKIHPFEKAKLLSGILVVTKGRPRIVRSGKFTPSPADTDALQSGPFLVETGRPITGLNAIRSAPRTVLATDGKGRWALLILSPVTLAGAAQALLASTVPLGFPVQQALNLDGGSSTALWVATPPQPLSHPGFATVRNFVAVLPR
jgi:uncharacterized protein YigE (DUF2233 family)